MSSYRFMRLIVFFDLPVETGEDKRAYRKFRKSLVKAGFVMVQESVYSKLMTTPSVENSVKSMIEKNKPDKGLVQVLTVTEKQYNRMEYIVGEKQSELVDSDKRLVIL